MVIAKGEKGGWLTPRKLSGGSTSGESWEEIMINPHMWGVEAKVTNSGRVQFEKNGEEVMIYVLVRPELTPKGKAALAAWNIKQEKARQIEIKKQAREEEKAERLNEKLNDLIAEAGGLEKFLESQE